MKISTRVQNILSDNSSEAWNIHAQAINASKNDPDVIILSLGDPNFDTPEHIKNAAIDGINQNDSHYLDVRGRLELRQAISNRYKKSIDQDINTDSITIFPGAQAGIYAIAQAMFDQNDEILIPDPAFLTYAPTIKSAGAIPVSVPCDNKTLKIVNLESMITSNTKAIMYSDPNNPTGNVLDIDELNEIARLCIKHNLIVISDEVYSQIAWNKKPISILTFPGMRERTFVIDGVSKSYAMTGWRLGWVISPSQFTSAINVFADMISHGLPGFIQSAATIALNSDNSDIILMRETYHRRSILIQEKLSKISNISMIAPDAGMFIVVNIEKIGLSGAEFALKLWEQTKVCALDGSVFGSSLKNYIRISLAVSEDNLVEACERIKNFCATV